MNRKILSLLLWVALTGASGAAQACDDDTLNAPVEAVAEIEKNPLLPFTAGRGEIHRRALSQEVQKSPLLPLTAGRGDIRRKTLSQEVRKNPLLPFTAGRGEIRRKALSLAVQKNPLLPLTAGRGEIRRKALSLAVRKNPLLPLTAGRGEIRRDTFAPAAKNLAAWKQTFKTMLDPRNLAQSCLATAVYFEARSESQLGQLAVAEVILNRSRASNYPSSICGVVYQGAHRLNGCQFSFACDGQSDSPQDIRAWETALAVTALALAEDRQLQIVAAATHYHADYVDPTWSKSLHRLTKIGRHIFYSQG